MRSFFHRCICIWLYVLQYWWRLILTVSAVLGHPVVACPHSACGRLVFREETWIAFYQDARCCCDCLVALIVVLCPPQYVFWGPRTQAWAWCVHCVPVPIRGRVFSDLKDQQSGIWRPDGTRNIAESKYTRVMCTCGFGNRELLFMIHSTLNHGQGNGYLAPFIATRFFDP